MAKIKLTKTELKAQTDALKRYMRFLPMLQLKKRQLQAEMAGIDAKAEAVVAKEREERAHTGAWVGLLATDAGGLDGLVTVKSVNLSASNIAGVQIPVFESIETSVREIDLWATPPWMDDAAEALKRVAALRCERMVLERQRELVERELVSTSQRVNLFEKVKIPECRENIRVIRIAIGDAQTAAVTRGKIAKSRSASAPDAEEGHAA